MQLSTIRKEKEITQTQLAKQSGVNIKSLQGYECGSRNINKASGETLYKLSKVLDVTIEDILNKEEIK